MTAASLKTSPAEILTSQTALSLDGRFGPGPSLLATNLTIRAAILGVRHGSLRPKTIRMTCKGGRERCGCTAGAVVPPERSYRRTARDSGPGHFSQEADKRDYTIMVGEGKRAGLQRLPGPL